MLQGQKIHNQVRNYNLSSSASELRSRARLDRKWPMAASTDALKQIQLKLCYEEFDFERLSMASTDCRLRLLASRQVANKRSNKPHRARAVA